MKKLTKKCFKCLNYKDVREFRKRKASKDGLDYRCKNCASLYDKGYYISNRQKLLRRSNQHRVLNQERHIWRAMIYRCTNSKTINFKYYGGSGIKVCDRWLSNFDTFFKDMGKRPSPKHSIDRIDNKGNYEPSNCKWSTRKEQNNNKRLHNFELRKLNILLFMLCISLLTSNKSREV